MSSATARRQPGHRQRAGRQARAQPAIGASGDSAVHAFDGTLDVPLNPLRVLVVDDCPVQRIMSCALLSKWGIQVETACDGAEAVLLATQRVFDMVLMDLRMPVMDGLAATARIRDVERAQRRAKAVPVIAYTGEPLEGNESAWARCGITGALPKPSDPAALAACLKRWCGVAPDATQH